MFAKVFEGMLVLIKLMPKYFIYNIKVNNSNIYNNIF